MPNWSELANQTIMVGTDPAIKIKEYLTKYHDTTGRNLIVYFSGFLSLQSNNTSIVDNDMIGITTAVHGLDCSKGLDIMLHTPGGDPNATESIVEYLHSKFNNDIRVIVPHMAMSAGTMLACASKEIIMAKHSSLGPVDPQFNGVPAFNIKKEFELAKKELKEDPNTITFWREQLNKYPAAFIHIVNDAIELSGELVKEWLKNYMFSDMPQNKEKTIFINKIVSALNTNKKSHSKHLSVNYCKNLGLKITPLESDDMLQDLVLSIHHLFTMLNGFSKIIMNHKNVVYTNR
ncbi:Periplasmic serine protease [Alteracholeplasma palmae J233]|uniref:Periplasmic serine protease n=1 Tax=Alteracholeplasma palmae (strain ATCC 49389 / J233) TaxID=1318466 RepID=U4KJW8_ALTPJ|nr:serine protease [Alteracholeplasma palmae]CCV63758.1 Periplasmic serine protease [Alteracholeplasma palmae J233]